MQRATVARMSENLRIWTKALYGFDHVARLAGPDDWDRPSPCDGWTARHVIGHVLAIQRYMESLMRDTPVTMNPMVDPHLNAGDDPYGAWAAARDGILEAADQPGVLHRVVQNWSGPTAVDDMLGFNVADTTIHSWDLARALGVDDRLDPACVARALANVEPVAERLRAGGMFGAPVEIGAGADAQVRLLASTGRSA
jgi:uncharacterized protein (TIGR03086 family)